MFGLMRTATHIRLMHEADKRVQNLADSQEWYHVEILTKLRDQELKYDALAEQHGRILAKLVILTRMQDPVLRERLREKLTEGD